MIARKVVFCVTWSILSIMGLVLYLGMNSTFIGYFLGFHLIKDLLVGAVAIGLYSKYPEFMFIFLLIFILFIIIWLIALFKIKTSKLFYWLVIIDNLISLLVYLVFALVNFWNFNSWHILIGLIIENVLVIVLVQRTKLLTNRNTQNAGDGSLIS